MYSSLADFVYRVDRERAIRNLLEEVVETVAKHNILGKALEAEDAEDAEDDPQEFGDVGAPDMVSSNELKLVHADPSSTAVMAREATAKPSMISVRSGINAMRMRCPSGNTNPVCQEYRDESNGPDYLNIAHVIFGRGQDQCGPGVNVELSFCRPHSVELKPNMLIGLGCTCCEMLSLMCV